MGAGPAAGEVGLGAMTCWSAGWVAVEAIVVADEDVTAGDASLVCTGASLLTVGVLPG